MIDNFDLIRSHLTFEKARKFDPNTGNLETINDTYDRYIIQIIKRAKDVGGKKYGVNTSNRLIHTYEVPSLEYYDHKKPFIIDLCEHNGARAYILPQVRSTYDCLKEMIKIGVDNLENPTVKFQHIYRSCMCAMHKSRDKKWIFDLDSDNMTEYIFDNKTLDLVKKVWTVDDVLKLIQNELVSIGKKPEDAYVVKTKSGHHIVSRPFNLMSAFGKCAMMFEGEHSVTSEVVWTGPGECDLKTKKVSGWLHKDGMTLLYLPSIKEEG